MPLWHNGTFQDLATYIITAGLEFLSKWQLRYPVPHFSLDQG